jgi:hypothetical protein
MVVIIAAPPLSVGKSTIKNPQSAIENQQSTNTGPLLMYEPYGNRTPPGTRDGRTARRRAAAADVYDDYVNLIVGCRVLSVYDEPLQEANDSGCTSARG